MTLVMRIKLLLTRPRLIFNPLLLLVFAAIWIRDFLYWFPKDAFGTSLNYWAYTDWLIDYSQGFIRRGLSGEIWRLVPSTVPPIEVVAVFSWILILTSVFGYLRLLVRSWKSFHPLTLFGLLFLPSLFMFYIHDHQAIARKEILGYVTLLLHLFVVEKSFPLGDGPAISAGNMRRYVGWLLPITVILLPAIILVHEGNFLLFVPLHGIITLTVLRRKERPNWARLPCGPGCCISLRCLRSERFIYLAHPVTQCCSAFVKNGRPLAQYAKAPAFCPPKSSVDRLCPALSSPCSGHCRKPPTLHRW